MTALLISIPISLLLVALAVGIFFWAVNSGQYEDLDSPAYMALMDDEQCPLEKQQEGGDQPADEARRTEGERSG